MINEYIYFLSPRLFSALAALFVSALVISVIFAIIPLCTNVLLLAVAMAVSGLAMGIIDTIANIQLVTIYQRDSAVFLQVKIIFISALLFYIPIRDQLACLTFAPRILA